jgi:hypothetical protein
MLYFLMNTIIKGMGSWSDWSVSQDGSHPPGSVETRGEKVVLRLALATTINTFVARDGYFFKEYKIMSLLFV